MRTQAGEGSQYFLAFLWLERTLPAGPGAKDGVASVHLVPCLGPRPLPFTGDGCGV